MQQATLASAESHPRESGARGAPLKLLQPPLVSFSGVTKTYDGTALVVRDLDLDIRRGEFLTLLGPSGSGKTTTLMMLAGFESPTTGEISLAGVPITRTPPHKRNFGMVFQNYALFPHMTVEQNVAYPLSVRGVRRPEQRTKVATALDMVQLGALGSRYPAQLSGGQQQRVALARALVFEPQLVLMDEPLGALDKQLREHMQIELKALHRRLGVSFVYVTHDQSEALTMSDRVAVFNDGAVQQVDRVDRLYEAPANRFVAGFVGDNTELDGVVIGSAGASCIVGLANGVRMTGVNVNGARAGDRVRCCIRPERIELTGVLNQANTFEATVADVIYFGDHLRLRCEVPGQADANVKLPLGTHVVPARGETVFLYAAEEYLRIYL
ncbi:MAG TPA: ABC transporter ATP-binding protein [Ramlibacter sp.]|nr:ABC transporter ATP-binding protein [Ramlibacter sp.]